MTRTRFSFRSSFSIKKTIPLLFKINTIPLIVLLTSSLFLAGCANKKVVDLNLQYVPTDRAPANLVDEQSQQQIAEAATAVGKSLQELSAVQMSVHPPTQLPNPFNPQVIGMDKLASISWTGPVKPILKKIAEATHYRLRVIGDKPALPVLVSLDIHDKPIADILRNITYQVVMKANIAVYPQSRTIELRYHGN